MTDFTDEQIAPVAQQISEQRKSAGDPHWHDSLSNWFVAIGNLRQNEKLKQKDLQDNITRGTCHH